jgi:parvulin-like peptidyl-prolyl isomerase
MPAGGLPAKDGKGGGAMNILTGFDWHLYSKPQNELTDQERLQVGVACIIYTSVEEARRTIKDSPKDVLEEALKISRAESKKTLTKLLEAQLRKLLKAVEQ